MIGRKNIHNLFDLNLLKSVGWVSCELEAKTDKRFLTNLLAIANQFGSPVASRAGGKLYDVLAPLNAEIAKPHSLSKIFSTGAFPLHVDTAHWTTPCRYLILACSSPGASSRATSVLNIKKVSFNEEQRDLLYNVPLQIINGRNSFFDTILSSNRDFIRFDPGCMKSTCRGGESALKLLLNQHWSNHIEQIQWHRGKVVIIDNWRVLHGRDSAMYKDNDRKLLRIIVK